MKRMIMMLCCALLFVCSPLSVYGLSSQSEEIIYADANALFQAWEKNGYPDYVCGIWSTDGSTNHLTIGILDNEAGNAGKKEILAQVQNPSSIRFVHQSHSKNELLAVMDDLCMTLKKQRVSDEIGLVGVGLYEEKNCVQMEILEEKKNEQATMDFVTEMQKKYDDAVAVSYTEDVYVLTDGVATTIGATLFDTNKYDPLYTNLIICTVGVVLLTGLVLFLFLKKQRSLLLQTNASTTEGTANAITIGQVKQLIKDSEVPFSEALDQRVFEAVEKVKQK